MDGGQYEEPLLHQHALQSLVRQLRMASLAFEHRLEPTGDTVALGEKSSFLAHADQTC